MIHRKIYSKDANSVCYLKTKLIKATTYIRRCGSKPWKTFAVGKWVSRLAGIRRGRRPQVAGGCVSIRDGGEDTAKRPRDMDTHGGPKGRKDRPTQYFLPAPRYMLPGQTLCRLRYLSGKFSPQAHLSSRHGELSRRGSAKRWACDGTRLR